MTTAAHPLASILPADAIAEPEAHHLTDLTGRTAFGRGSPAVRFRSTAASSSAWIVCVASASSTRCFGGSTSRPE